MATGDNVLTAISVAHQCSIICEEKEVIFGDIAKNMYYGEKFIEWKNITTNESTMQHANPSGLNTSTSINKEIITERFQLI